GRGVPGGRRLLAVTARGVRVHLGVRLDAGRVHDELVADPPVEHVDRAARLRSVAVRVRLVPELEAAGLEGERARADVEGGALDDHLRADVVDRGAEALRRNAAPRLTDHAGAARRSVRGRRAGFADEVVGIAGLGPVAHVAVAAVRIG